MTDENGICMSKVDRGWKVVWCKPTNWTPSYSQVRV